MTVPIPARRGRPGFGTGLTAVPRGVSALLTTRGVKRHVLIPILINLVVGGLLTWLVYSQVSKALGPATGRFDGLVGLLVRSLALIGALIASGFVITRFGVILGSPFYNQLAERIEARYLGRVPDEPFTVASALGDMGRALRFEVTKSGLAMLSGLVVVAIGFVPIVGQIASSVLGIALAAWVACMDYFDRALDRRRLSFREKHHYVTTRRPGSIGFGLVAALCSFVPVANLFLVPVCIAGGTLFYCGSPLEEPVTDPADTADTTEPGR